MEMGSKYCTEFMVCVCFATMITGIVLCSCTPSGTRRYSPEYHRQREGDALSAGGQKSAGWKKPDGKKHSLVRVKALIDTNGQVIKIKINDDLDNEIREQVLEAVSKMEFTPATGRGGKVAMWINLNIRIR